MKQITFVEWVAKYENESLITIAHFGLSNLSTVTDEIDYHHVSRIMTSKIEIISGFFKW